MPQIIEAPETLVDLLQNTQRVRDAFALLNALAQMEVNLVPPGSVSELSAGNRPIRGDPPNLVLPLPLKLTRTIADASDEADAVTKLNLLLAELRKTKMLPS